MPKTGKIVERTVTILNGQSLSEEIFIGDAVVVAVQPDSAWNTAAISFQGRTENNALGTLKFEGSELIATAIDSEEYVTFTPGKFAGVEYLKVRSGTNGAAVNQTGDSVITLILRGIS